MFRALAESALPARHSGRWRQEKVEDDYRRSGMIAPPGDFFLVSGNSIIWHGWRYSCYTLHVMVHTCFVNTIHYGFG